MPEEQEKLPKPLTDLPLPEKDLPLPEKELPEHASEPKKTSSINENENPKGSMILKSFLLGILFVILVVLIGGGAFFLGRGTKDNPQITETIVSAPTPSEDPTADWKTYSGNFYSFKYPDSWFPYAAGEKQGEYTLPNDGQGEFFLSPLNSGSPEIQLEVSPTKDTSKKVMEDVIKDYSWTNKVISNIKIDDVNAIKVTGISNGSENAVVVFGNDIYVYKIQSGGKEIYNFEQILSTFKFTDLEISVSPTINPNPSN